MYCYAQLDENDICIAISDLSGEIFYDNMIKIEKMDDNLLGKKYKNGIFQNINN